MIPKPRGLGPEHAAQFQDRSIVAAYPYRPEYPEETFSVLTDILICPPAAARVLDLGCGTGDIARRLAPYVGRVDALDISAPMIELGRTLPGGNRDNLRWITGAAEDAPLDPPYALVTAAESLHWMDWYVVLPRIRSVLTEGGFLAIVGRNEIDNPWWPDLLTIIQRFSTNRDYEPYGPTFMELERRNLFRVIGDRTTAPVRVDQSVDDYIESIHSRNGFSRDRMAPDVAEAFDAECMLLLSSHANGGVLTFGVSTTVIWGTPIAHTGMSG